MRDKEPHKMASLALYAFYAGKNTTGSAFRQSTTYLQRIKGTFLYAWSKFSATNAANSLTLTFLFYSFFSKQFCFLFCLFYFSLTFQVKKNTPRIHQRFFLLVATIKFRGKFSDATDHVKGLSQKRQSIFQCLTFSYSALLALRFIQRFLHIKVSIIFCLCGHISAV